MHSYVLASLFWLLYFLLGQCPGSILNPPPPSSGDFKVGSKKEALSSLKAAAETSGSILWVTPPMWEPTVITWIPLETRVHHDPMERKRLCQRGFGKHFILKSLTPLCVHSPVQLTEAQVDPGEVLIWGGERGTPTSVLNPVATRGRCRSALSDSDCAARRGLDSVVGSTQSQLARRLGVHVGGRILLRSWTAQKVEERRAPWRNPAVPSRIPSLLLTIPLLQCLEDNCGKLQSRYFYFLSLFLFWRCVRARVCVYIAGDQTHHAAHTHT
jgi:hypothetical protein